ncbi:hypothetical protein GOARA_046_00350 [Gordonia araii NBRC 100433]|uniref:DUF4878 domain-containing protein n=1 Tax=Gordonia araii NBRC 100433 TaxID=1073574 RepID=G7H1P1_9ACTN|nr:hypothetical protein GOARA_046_00350 [Gordonia araii NBRC 100433]
MNINGVRAAKVVSDDQAVVEVDSFRTATPHEIVPSSINLMKVDGEWKVCSPE